MNRLGQETSPYLLQHADNPVDWYPWGPEALGKAQQENKPILLSIGYSACHWCHVMAHESFEDPATAEMMNLYYVNIKVDREERPDLDAIYMQAVQAMTNHGGWPMTVFLTPDGLPFYGGTYFPPEPRHGMPAFQQVLHTIADTYYNQPEEIQKNIGQMRDFLQQTFSATGAGTLSQDILAAGFHALSRNYDNTNGGFGQAPKFPQPMNLEFLLHAWHNLGDDAALRIVEVTLQKMARGGMYDQLGGGFHRYSVDARWLVPHFEKMLYDNAQLARVYLHAYQATGKSFYRRIVEETLDYVLREMTHPAGGFYSTQDADSEGEEGKFFLWTPAETNDLLGAEDGELFNAYYDITAQGNFEGSAILNVPRDRDVVAHMQGVPEEGLQQVIDRSRQALFYAREQRVKPGRDEKILASWNGLMLAALAEAGAALQEPAYLLAARKNAEFVLTEMLQHGRLMRTWKDGQARITGYLEDYAGYADGLLSLYEATGELRWFTAARQLMDTVLELFSDTQQGGFYDTSTEHEQLVTRPKDLFDNATPAGSSLAVTALLRLGAFTGDDHYIQPAAEALSSIAEFLQKYPTGFGVALTAVDFYLNWPKEIAIIGTPGEASTQALQAVVFGMYLPNRIIATAGPQQLPAVAAAIPLLAERQRLSGKATAYVCVHFACQIPVTEPEMLKQQLQDSRKA
ncbi:MAG: thioredoxin domain-containing protein [Chloroflexi bacterium]|nr:thioredoxin domain-containing protein [Chloroflexota bacterium]